MSLLDEAGTAVVQRLVESGFDVVEWTASRGDAFDDADDDEGDDGTGDDR
ncbi:hypothetical protein [Cellulosimicrobium sp. CUA-896]